MVAIALVIAWGYAATVLRHTRPFVLPDGGGWPRFALGAALLVLGALAVYALLLRLGALRAAVAAVLLLGLPPLAAAALSSVQLGWRELGGRFALVALPLAFVIAARWLRRGQGVLAVLALAGFAVAAVPRTVTSMRRFAQVASDRNRQLAPMAAHLRNKHPGALVMTDRALPGVATLAIPARSPGELFEALETLDVRPSHFAVDPAAPFALALRELMGELLYRVPLGPQFEAGTQRADLQLFAASFDHAGTAERPVTEHAGWAIVDRVDLADRASEAAHGFTARADAADSVLGREVGPHGLLLDGGRTLRDARFTLRLDPARPMKLIIRTGGARSYPGAVSLERETTLRITDGRDELARATVPAPSGSFLELGFAVPATATLALSASAPIRVFHIFVLQPE